MKEVQESALAFSGSRLASASALALLCFLGTGCGDDSADEGREIATVEEGEWAPGGAATNRYLLGSQAFIIPAPNLTPEHETQFFSGNSFFNQAWVEAPASTTARDGLGPTFNARTCSGCHFKDGRGAPPEGDEKFSQMLLRISVPGDGEHGAITPVPGYGGQLQPESLPDVPAEGTPRIEWEEVAGTYDDGTPYSLRRPTYFIDNPAFGAFPDDLLISPRVAPAMVGLGLLEAIPDERLEALADPDDADGDGISGRPNLVWDVRKNDLSYGRFGWKAEQPTVEQQSAGAFNGDMGLTTELFPAQNCPEAQSDCLEQYDDGEPEVDETTLDRVALYSRAIAVPARRAYDTREVLRGKLLFNQAGCVGCHTPSHTTGTNEPLPEMEDQLIWPYTDMLLHDMGDGLSDNRPTYAADGNEWRTPPLWSVGLIETVNKHEYLLHDGRARGVAEAILWHGGEAEAARDAFKAMDVQDREALLTFVRSL